MKLQERCEFPSEQITRLNEEELSYIRELIFKKNDTIFDMAKILSEIESKWRELKFTLEWEIYYYNRVNNKITLSKDESNYLATKAKLIEKEITRLMNNAHYWLRNINPIIPGSILIYVHSNSLPERRRWEKNFLNVPDTSWSNSFHFIKWVKKFIQRIV